METPGNSAFVARLDEWRESLGLGHNALARHLGISHPYWHQLRTGQRRPGADLMRRVIASSPEPWQSALKQARSADMEAADAAAAVVA